MSSISAIQVLVISELPPDGEAAQGPVRAGPQDPGGLGEGEGAPRAHCGGCVP